MPLLETLHRLLNRKRLAYAWLVGVALWAGWLASILLGPGEIDLAGQVVGTDYLEFYTAGYTLRAGDSARLYDAAYQSALQQQLIGPGLRNYYAFITPPFLAWPFAVLSLLPYSWSFAAWSLLSLLALWASLRLLGLPAVWRPLGWSLTWFPVFAAVSYGQNALLSLFIFCLTFRLWRGQRMWAAGLACSLLMYKPQLAAGVAVLWLLDWRRSGRALAGLVVGSAALAGLCFWLLPEASWAYVKFTFETMPALPNWLAFPIYNLHSVRGFWRLLLPQVPVLADSLAALVAAAGILGFVLFRRRFGDRPALLYAGTVCLTFWIVPHAMIYDWAPLLIPAVLLWQEAPRLSQGWKVLFALVWVVGLLSFPLTYLQLLRLPVAIQISVPVLLLATALASRWLGSPPGWAVAPPPEPASAVRRTP